MHFFFLQICLFYLVLRALDTVEDDTSFPKDIKLPLLREFYAKLEDRDFCVKNCGTKPAEKELLEQYYRVVDVYITLDKKYRDVIADICKKMGNGMADFIDRQRVDSIEDYNLYCHYVAGLVGHGLTKLFMVSNCEDISFEQTANISNSMGLFLQKTNIIRDYYEDIVDGRIFWPKEVWSNYANDIADFKEPQNIDNAVKCLNHLVTEALTLIPDCLEYIDRLKKTQEVFNFCAIPQVMAIATLVEIYNNPKVFKGNVKIRKGLAAKLFQDTKTVADVARIFYYFTDKLEKKVDPKDPNAALALEYIKKIKKLTAERSQGVVPFTEEGTSFFTVFAGAVAVAGAAAAGYYYFKK